MGAALLYLVLQYQRLQEDFKKNKTQADESLGRYNRIKLDHEEYKETFGREMTKIEKGRKQCQDRLAECSDKLQARIRDVEGCEEDKGKVQSQYDKAKEYLSEAEGILSEQEDQLAVMERVIQKFSDENEKLGAKVEERETLIKDAEKELTALDVQVESLTKKLHESEAQNKYLETQMEKMKASAKVVDETDDY